MPGEEELEDAAALGEEEGQAPGGEEEAGAGAGGAGDGGKSGLTIEALHQKIEQLSRQAGRFGSLNAQLSKLPKTVEEQVKKLLADQQENQRRQGLSPTERQAEEIARQQEEALQKMIEDRALQAFQSKYGTLAERLESSFKNQDYYRDLDELAGEDADTLRPIYKDLFSEKIADMESGDEAKAEAAARWVMRAEKDAPYLVLEAIKAQSRFVDDASGKAVASRKAGASAAAQSPKGGGKAPKGQITLEQLNAMTEEQREELINRDPKMYDAILAQKA